MSRINEDLRNIYDRHRNNPINMNSQQQSNRNVTDRQTNTVSQSLNTNRQNINRIEREALAQMERRHEEEKRRLRARFDENLETQRRNVQFRQPINNTPPQ